jgi:integrase
VKRAFKWASARQLVGVGGYTALRAVEGLKEGRTDARESRPVGPADPARVAATLPMLNPHVRTMVELLQLTGMRPGEVCRRRLAEVDRARGVWVYRPARHKTQHRGKDRVIPLGPRARAVIEEWLRRDGPPPEGFEDLTPAEGNRRLVAADAYQDAGRARDASLLRDVGRGFVVVAGCVVDPDEPLFSPAREREERFARWRRARKSKVPPSQRNRRKAAPARAPSAEYYAHALNNAIRVACGKAGVSVWHANQLRHGFATEVRPRYGLEAAQVRLGHSRADTTEIYAERDLALAVRVPGRHPARDRGAGNNSFRSLRARG